MPSDFDLFHSLQNALNGKKKISRRSEENVYGKVLELEISRNLLEGDQHDIWQKVIQNISEYTMVSKLD